MTYLDEIVESERKAKEILTQTSEEFENKLAEARKKQKEILEEEKAQLADEEKKQISKWQLEIGRQVEMVEKEMAGELSGLERIAKDKHDSAVKFIIDRVV